MQIRRAAAKDVDALSALAMRAKAHWGYAPAQLEGWSDSLRQSVDSVRTRPVFVAELEGKMAGFYALLARGDACALDDLWVAPDCMNRGVGRALVAHARETAAALGAASLHIDADPHAERFYVACGARRVGELTAPIEGQPDRVRPQLVLPVTQEFAGASSAARMV